jgi:large subunit ribosomal protein L12
MEYIHAALLLHSAGKDITEDTVETVLEAAGVDVDSSQVKALVAALDGVDVEEAMNQAAAGAAAPAAEAESGEEEAAEEEEEAAEEDESDEEADEDAAEGLGGLF